MSVVPGYLGLGDGTREAIKTQTGHADTQLIDR